jgi:NAD(P)-dependent dehydrogenase (short-subunit alcohol dehydrogenase family)
MASRKTAVVVGGSRGIGLAVAQALAARGETVVVTSRDPERAGAAASQVGDGAVTVVFDLTSGMARERPYPGSTTVGSVNGGVTALVRSLAVELAPVRVNPIHPGFVSDSPYYAGNTQMTEFARSRTPGGRLMTTADCVGATPFLLDNQGMNGANLALDAGILLT